ncbi:hypothetical protein Tfer_0743 [Thermincola ferriacetica]|uniref:Uncharacterized protein n=1 Tax=Thermincola ferriacetica TaxID=281456 RepID=A0A0L6W627_9FIRM|nr:hypothetical protein Tfer_0743 [Thermincola ferriacetica]
MSKSTMIALIVIVGLAIVGVLGYFIHHLIL